jgi:hypothetical protein
MSWILAVTSKTERTGQSVGDIVAVYDFEPTPNERELFGVQDVEKMKAQDVYDELNAALNPDKQYPKFPFSMNKLKASDKTVLANPSSTTTEIRNIIKKITPKTPTGAVAVGP